MSSFLYQKYHQRLPVQVRNSFGAYNLMINSFKKGQSHPMMSRTEFQRMKSGLSAIKEFNRRSKNISWGKKFLMHYRNRVYPGIVHSYDRGSDQGIMVLPTWPGSKSGRKYVDFVQSDVVPFFSSGDLAHQAILPFLEKEAAQKVKKMR